MTCAGCAMVFEARGDPTPRVFTIPPGCPFVDVLASGILLEIGDDPIALSDVQVLLPTRRACRALADAFLRVTPGGRPQLLPRMSPLGDIEADALMLAADDLPSGAASFDLPTPIAPMRRQILLTRLIMSRGDLGLTLGQAFRLAGDLTRLIDLAATHRLGFDRLAALVPEELARHWQVTLDFLKLVTERWPAILQELGAVDPADYRNRVLEAQAALWQARPPEHPVIAAGSTGSIPATAELIATVAKLPHGAVVLPGLDRDMDSESWDALDDSHPQIAMKHLLATIGLDRRQVPDWPGSRPRPDRRPLLREVMRPPATTEAWLDLHELDTGTADGMLRVEAASEREEAGVIALMLRETLETPGRTAALVTPDRRLARRVAAELERWDLAVDDSAGRPLAATPVGAFLRLAATVTVGGFAPVGLLSLLKHPLATAGLDRASLRSTVRLLEREALRGPRPRPGLSALREAVSGKDLPDAECRTLTALIDRIAALADPFEQRLARPTAALTELIAAHIAFAEGLAATESLEGADRLWRQDDGEAAAIALADLADAVDGFPPIATADYPGLIDAVLEERVVRPRYGEHPRLSIWGPLEARLLQADRLILGSLNEGTWPRLADADPWMSRPMRTAFGLPSPERRIGLSAHDFAQAAAAPEIVLTRATRVDGTPMVPSRWLMRLDTVAAATRLEIRRATPDSAAPWLDWFAALDRPDAVRPTAPPEPRPPHAARPDRISVSDTQTLMSDPYAFYARKVLRLEQLEPLEADPGAADRGQIIHQILARFLAAPQDACSDQEEALQQLLTIGRTEFAVLAVFPAVRAFWWPRFERVARWFIAQEVDWKAQFRTLACEQDGRLSVPGLGREVTLTARADRIDVDQAGKLAILDYKTGQLPSKKQVAHGFAPQLPLEGLIARAGGFRDLPAAPVGALIYWRLSGGDPAGTSRDAADGKPDVAIANAEAGLTNLIALFEREATPYLSRPRRPPGSAEGPYDHLARLAEWSVAGGEDEA